MTGHLLINNEQRKLHVGIAHCLHCTFNEKTDTNKIVFESYNVNLIEICDFYLFHSPYEILLTKRIV